MNLYNNIPWIEKYRPRKLNQVISQEESISILNNTLKTGELPHLLIYGAPGTGKTSSILALSNQLFGPDRVNERVIELNASDERGINVVRGKIITFSKTAIGTPDPKYLCPPYKIIILDEADALTLDAQSALRKVIESASKITRFCFTCNYIEKIIQPIISRCVKFRFKPLSIDVLSDRLSKIASLENININEDCIRQIAKNSDGDGRKAIMILQNSKYIIKIKKNITPVDCDEFSGITPNNILDDIWNKTRTSSIYEMYDLVKFVINNSININDLLQFYNKKIIESNLSDNKKSILITEILNISSKLLEKSDEFLQILYLFSLINSCNK
jgi:replication factor C subunit 2/4